MEDISIVGRKTFFIAPVESLLPETHLERLLSHGYECYSIINTGNRPIQKKVEDIVELYPGCILFFNIDAVIPGIDWKDYIKRLCAKHKSDAKIGIIYAERYSAVDKMQIENFYRDEAGITCGCIPLSSKNADNYELILEALAHAGARGRREIVRAYCNNESTADFFIGKKEIHGKLNDVNRAYFCCIFPEIQDSIKIYEQIHDIELNVNGFEFTADAVLIMKHCREGVNKYVFMFVKPDGSPELEKPVKTRLNKKIYSMVTGQVKERLEAYFGK